MLSDFKGIERDIVMQTPEQFLRVFGELKPLLVRKQASATRQEPPKPPASASWINEIFRTMKPLIDKERERFTDNPWIMAGLGRYEVRNCAVLAQLWDQRISGTYASSFLSAFVERIRGANSALPSREELEGHYIVRTEHCPNGLQSDRVDITIEGSNFLVGIEAKIDADVRQNQLEDYCSVIKARAAGLNIDRQKHCVIFLTTDGRSAPGVVSASWRDIAAAARQCERALEPQYGTHNWLVQRFADHLMLF